MKHKVAELEGALLDAAAALADGWQMEGPNIALPIWKMRHGLMEFGQFMCPKLSTDWAEAGPIIERERITVRSDFSTEHPGHWAAFAPTTGYGEGPTALIAAMRAYVASKLGDEVELPD